MYDVIVVGARCAGAATAMLLARAGHRVLLLDRARFPSDTLSTLYIHQPGLALLARWGLLEEVLATGSPLLTSLSFTVPGARLAGPAPVLGSIAGGCAPRRYALDHLLVEAAVRAGAEFRPRSGVLALHWEGSAVAGVRCGSGEIERARLVVGADGRNSTVARLVRAPFLRQDPKLTYACYSYWSGIPHQGMRLFVRQWAGTACVPTQDGLTLVAVQFSRTGPAVTDRPRAYRELLRRTSPELDELIAGGRQEERLFCCADLPNFFRRPYGPGWVLVGDAAHHKDPIGARGITDAFVQAGLLAGHLDGPLDDGRRVTAALRRYARDLGDEFTTAYEDNLLSARLDLDSYRAEMVANQHDPAYVAHFFRGYAGVRA